MSRDTIITEEMLKMWAQDTTARENFFIEMVGYLYHTGIMTKEELEAKRTSPRLANALHALYIINCVLENLLDDESMQNILGFIGKGNAQ